MSDPTPEQLEREAKESEERTSEQLRTPQEERVRRKSICEGCEAKTSLFALDACSECNCLLLFKIPVITSTCPKGKW